MDMLKRCSALVDRDRIFAFDRGTRSVWKTETVTLKISRSSGLTRDRLHPDNVMRLILARWLPIETVSRP